MPVKSVNFDDKTYEIILNFIKENPKLNFSKCVCELINASDKIKLEKEVRRWRAIALKMQGKDDLI